MRGLFLFGTRASRNDNQKAVDPHPLTNYGNDVDTGRPAHDGFTVLSRANPDAQGSPPPVNGVIGRTHRGPDESFEE